MGKTLEQGIFRIQKVVMRLNAAQPCAFLQGLDWRRVHGGRRLIAP